MEEKTIFEKCETIGREIFTDICENKIPGCKINRFSENQYQAWDVSYTIKSEGLLGHTYNYIGEIKVRNHDSDTFSNQYFEKVKNDGMKLEQQKLKVKKPRMTTTMTYITIFNDGHYKIFNVDKIAEEEKPITKELPKSQQDKTLVEKEIYQVYNDKIIQSGQWNKQ